MSEITLTGWDILDEARAMLRTAVAGVPADGWQRPTPCGKRRRWSPGPAPTTPPSCCATSAGVLTGRPDLAG